MDLLDFSMRYLVTTELETSFFLKVKRFFRLEKPKKEFFLESWYTRYPGDVCFSETLKARIKIIKTAKQRLVWKQ
jgi:hypothetical protein